MDNLGKKKKFKGILTMAERGNNYSEDGGATKIA